MKVCGLVRNAPIRRSKCRFVDVEEMFNKGTEWALVGFCRVLELDIVCSTQKH